MQIPYKTVVEVVVVLNLISDGILDLIAQFIRATQLKYLSAIQAE